MRMTARTRRHKQANPCHAVHTAFEFHFGRAVYSIAFPQFRTRIEDTRNGRICLPAAWGDRPAVRRSRSDVPTEPDGGPDAKGERYSQETSAGRPVLQRILLKPYS